MNLTTTHFVPIHSYYDAVRYVLATLTIAQVIRLYEADPNFDLWEYVERLAERIVW